MSHRLLAAARGSYNTVVVLMLQQFTTYLYEVRGVDKKHCLPSIPLQV